MRYLVTGATGFIGREVTRQLRAAGHTVVAVVRDPAAAADLAALGVDLRRGDITDRASLRSPMEGVDGVFHIAGWYRVGSRDVHMAERVNVEGTRNVLELMREMGVPRGVYTSTVGVFGSTSGPLPDETYRVEGPWLNAYFRTKWLAHYAVAEPMMLQELPLVVVQPSVVYGPGDPSGVGVTLRRYLQRRLPVLPLESGYSWGHVEDTARGHLLAMERGRTGESYIVTGPTHTWQEAIALAERITGIPGPRFWAPPWLLRGAAQALEPVARVIPMFGTYHPETLRSAAGTRYAGSSAKAERELGLRMRPLEEGLRQTLLAEMERLGLRPPRR